MCVFYVCVWNRVGLAGSGGEGRGELKSNVETAVEGWKDERGHGYSRGMKEEREKQMKRDYTINQ